MAKMSLVCPVSISLSSNLTPAEMLLSKITSL